MKTLLKQAFFVLAVSGSTFACKGTSGKKHDDTTVVTADSLKVSTDSSAKKMERTVKATKSVTFNPATQDSTVIEDSVIHRKTIIKHPQKK